jgi:pimeloyl-ACP methyl ester carboxylesterase
MSKKIPLVLLPAFLSTGDLWRRQAKALADVADVQIISLTRHDSIEGMASLVLDRAPDRFALAGLSLGGFTAFEIMRRAPERVTRLALVSTTARLDAPERLEGRKAQMQLVRAGHFAEAIKPYLTIIQSRERPLTSEALETVLQMCAEVGPDGLMNQQTAMMNRPDSRPGLGAISCSTVVICGRQDQSWPLENSKELAALIPGAKLVVIEDCGHFPTLDQPEETTAALRAWLLS